VFVVTKREESQRPSTWGTTAAYNTPASTDSQERTLHYPNGGDVIVFRNKKAHSDGMAFIW